MEDSEKTRSDLLESTKSMMNVTLINTLKNIKRDNQKLSDINKQSRDEIDKIKSKLN